MNNFFDQPHNRRQIISKIAQSTLGVSFLSNWSSLLEANDSGGKFAKRVIYFYMAGAMSHIDTFDPKPGTDVQGEVGVINTKTPGVKFGQYMSNLANLQDKIAIVRSMTTETADHEKGRYWLRTSYPMLGSIRHPSMGSWIVNSMGKINTTTLPPFVLVGNGNDHPGAGFLDPTLTPVPIADPKKGLENTKLPEYLTESAFKRRLDLASKIDKKFQSRYKNHAITSYNEMYKEAVKLMGSSDLEAFDLSKEPESVLEKYGDSRIGLGALLARRLISSGVRFVEVESGGWDMHNNVADEMSDKGTQLDKALGSLIEELHDSGLLSETLIVVSTEFGRSPNINQNAGRDHHPAAFSCLLAGAGIQGGAIYGKSDERGHGIDEDGVGLSDFNTTIAAACGIDYQKDQIAPNGRPFKIGGGGEPIMKILS